MGRLGNQMFEIASTIGIADRSGQPYAFPYWMNYDAKERFGSKEDIDIQKYFKNDLPLLVDESRYQFIEWPYYWGYRYENFSNGGNYNLNAHMQSEKFFEHCSYLIRYYFELKDPKPQNDYCAIHLRFGDYDNSYHPFTPRDYIRKAMAYFPMSSFMVFSDDVHKAIEYFPENDPRVNIMMPCDTMTDFAAMQACKDFIICNSTFSWWAAWLGKHPEKRVICPRKWHGDHTGLDPTDIPAKNWIVI
jgi:hypothetical protein